MFSQGKSSVPLFLTILAILLSAGSLSAQTSTGVVQAGHTIQISVVGHPEFSGAYKVSPNGLVDYTLLPGIPVIGLTSTDIRELVAIRLVQNKIEPNLFVVISDIRLISFQVHGYVRSPGKYEAESPIDMQIALLMAGGIEDDGDNRRIKVLRLVGNERQEIMTDQLEWYLQDSTVFAPQVQDRDIIIVMRKFNPYLVRVIGSVPKPGEYLPLPDEDVAQLLYRTGGFDAKADLKHVVIIRRTDGRHHEIVVNLKKIFKKGKVEEIPLIQGGDIIVVREIPPWTTYEWWAYGLREALFLFSTYLLIQTLVNQ